MIGLARIVAILVLLAVGGAIGGCRPGGDSNASNRPDVAGDDAQLWHGDWRLVSATHGGQTEVLDGGWQVHGDRYDVTLGGKADEHWQFTLDPGARRFDSLATWGPAGSHQDYLTATGNTDASCVCRMKGLYEVSPGQLRVVFDPAGREYPQSFDVAADSRFTIFVFQREAK
jgi:uncharacterized protein (TIGR03067 family)